MLCMWLLSCISKIWWVANQKPPLFHHRRWRRTGWINCLICVVFLNRMAMLEQFCSLSFLCSFSLRSNFFKMFSYYFWFCHIWNTLHMTFVLFVMIKVILASCEVCIHSQPLFIHWVILCQFSEVLHLLYAWYFRRLLLSCQTLVPKNQAESRTDDILPILTWFLLQWWNESCSLGDLCRYKNAY